MEENFFDRKKIKTKVDCITPSTRKSHQLVARTKKIPVKIDIFHQRQTFSSTSRQSQTHLNNADEGEMLMFSLLRLRKQTKARARVSEKLR
jgi:hypothetical protein